MTAAAAAAAASSSRAPTGGVDIIPGVIITAPAPVLYAELGVLVLVLEEEKEETRFTRGRCGDGDCRKEKGVRHVASRRLRRSFVCSSEFLLRRRGATLRRRNLAASVSATSSAAAADLELA